MFIVTQEKGVENWATRFHHMIRLIWVWNNPFMLTAGGKPQNANYYIWRNIWSYSCLCPLPSCTYRATACKQKGVNLRQKRRHFQIHLRKSQENNREISEFLKLGNVPTVTFIWNVLIFFLQIFSCKNILFCQKFSEINFKCLEFS